MPDVLVSADVTRKKAIKDTDDATREKFAQYLTPKETAAYAASMFSVAEPNEIRCLDLGGGTGILSTALFERYGASVNIDVIEIDHDLANICEKELSGYGIRHRIIEDDAIAMEYAPIYDRVILNPPYKKMAASDERQKVLPIKAANLYSAFVTRAIEALRPGGECVAIIPRSWTNGEYFAGFRNWLYERASIDWMHVYESRDEVFSDTNVLQETMLVKISKQGQLPKIKVTESVGKTGAVTSNMYAADALICGFAKSKIVRIKPASPSLVTGFGTLRDNGLLASTGKIVDFRSREKTKSEPGPDRVPLVYSCNFSKGGFTHPVDAGKKQWYWCSDDKDKKLLIGPGSFVVVKRFSSKEEPKRIKAYAFHADAPVALENHQNFIHSGKPRTTIPLDDEVAKGLSIWLNSSAVDGWFRSVSGSTQVNASDLNQIPVPPMGKLRDMARSWRVDLEQSEIDSICEEVASGK